jgi:hypothetical protein
MAQEAGDSGLEASTELSALDARTLLLKVLAALIFNLACLGELRKRH